MAQNVKTIVYLTDGAPPTVWNVFERLEESGVAKVEVVHDERALEKALQKNEANGGKTDLLLLDMTINADEDAGRNVASRIRAGEMVSNWETLPIMAVTADPRLTYSPDGPVIDVVGVWADRDSFEWQIRNLLDEGRPKQNDDRDKILLVGDEAKGFRQMVEALAKDENMGVIAASTPDALMHAAQVHGKRIQLIIELPGLSETMEEALMDTNFVFRSHDNPRNYIKTLAITNDRDPVSPREYRLTVSRHDEQLLQKLNAVIFLVPVDTTLDVPDIIGLANEMDPIRAGWRKEAIKYTFSDGEEAALNRHILAEGVGPYFDRVKRELALEDKEARLTSSPAEAPEADMNALRDKHGQQAKEKTDKTPD